MTSKYFQVDAFTSKVFGGNAAGVCLLARWLSGALLQRIAAENNQAETAFLVPDGEDWQLRWFSPTIEIDLCGHATLASARVLLSELGISASLLRFHTRSGVLTAERRGEIIELDFPSRPPQPCETLDELLRGLQRAPKQVYKSRDYLAVFENEADVAVLKPNFESLQRLDCLGVIATAPASGSGDFVSRFFAPRAGISEDPATGSSHCTLIPFWAERLGKSEMFARQLSARGGEFHCRHLGDRVGIGGQAIVYSRGEIQVPDERS